MIKVGNHSDPILINLSLVSGIYISKSTEYNPKTNEHEQNGWRVNYVVVGGYSGGTTLHTLYESKELAIEELNRIHSLFPEL